MLAGQVITGGWVSTHRHGEGASAVLPLPSVAVLVTVVTPTGKADPLAGTLVTTCVTAQLSLAVTVNVTLLGAPAREAR